MKRWIAVAVAPAALLAGTAALAAGPRAERAAQTGGLSVAPAVLTHAPQPGPLGTMTVTNRSAGTLTVSVTPRPWTESAAGEFAANRRAALSQVKVGEPSFTLAPGAAKKVDVSLTGAPAGGSLYGALEIVGIPAGASKRGGVVVGYRLVGTLRLPPAQRKLSLVAGKAKRAGKAAVLPVTNKGNTIDPVSGTVTVKSARGTLNEDVEDLKILPGKTVNIMLASAPRSGSYSATVTLKQGGTKLLTAKRKFSVR
jgi:hypothetical protein